MMSVWTTSQTAQDTMCDAGDAHATLRFWSSVVAKKESNRRSLV